MFVYPVHLCVPAGARERPRSNKGGQVYLYSYLTSFMALWRPLSLLRLLALPKGSVKPSLITGHGAPDLSPFPLLKICLSFFCCEMNSISMFKKRKPDRLYLLTGPLWMYSSPIYFLYWIWIGWENAFITFYPPSEPGRDLLGGWWVEERGGNDRLTATGGFKFHLLLPWSFWAFAHSLAHSLSLPFSPPLPATPLPTTPRFRSSVRRRGEGGREGNASRRPSSGDSQPPKLPEGRRSSFLSGNSRRGNERMESVFFASDVHLSHWFLLWCFSVVSFAQMWGNQWMHACLRACMCALDRGYAIRGV